MFKEVVRRILPAWVYRRGRDWYKRIYSEKPIPLLCEESFRHIIKYDLGLKPGELVFVHSSIDQLRPDFSFIKILPMLRSVLGEDSTLLFPSTQLSERPEQWFSRGEVFDVHRSPTSMGLLPELARRLPGAQRSLHPTHSVTAIGPEADEFVSTHHEDIYPCGPLSPYGKLVEKGGIILGLGVNTDILTQLHSAEDELKSEFPVDVYRSELFEGRVRDKFGNERMISTRVPHPRIRWRRPGSFLQKHVSDSVCKKIFVQGRSFYRVDASGLHFKICYLAKQGITMYSRGIQRGSVWESSLSKWAEELEKR
ncbi:MAG: AAC(3) family N-acetyltransferase [Candidatus Latescibacterota bacterium]|nr:AAC(3) family N-acetyltransferase [Candidatus Latescibacterota bacterium]